MLGFQQKDRPTPSQTVAIMVPDDLQWFALVNNSSMVRSTLDDNHRYWTKMIGADVCNNHSQRLEPAPRGIWTVEPVDQLTLSHWQRCFSMGGLHEINQCNRAPEIPALKPSTWPHFSVWWSLSGGNQIQLNSLCQQVDDQLATTGLQPSRCRWVPNFHPFSPVFHEINHLSAGHSVHQPGDS